MSRSGYSDDCDNHVLYRQAVDRALFGKRGQKLLSELAAAMDAMPEKKLIASELQRSDGSYCALGVVGAARGVDMSTIDPEDAPQVARSFDIAESMAREIAYINDDEWCWESDHRETPEQRWLRVRKWVDLQMVRS